jgi:hypothetical protein
MPSHLCQYFNAPNTKSNANARLVYSRPAAIIRRADRTFLAATLVVALSWGPFTFVEWALTPVHSLPVIMAASALLGITYVRLIYAAYDFRAWLLAR